MKSKFLATLAVALTSTALLVACGDDSSSSAASNDGEYKREFATAIASGETMFIGTMSLEHTDDVGKDFVEVGTRAGVVYYDNSLFITDMDIGSIARYSLDENNKIGGKQGEITLNAVGQTTCFL